RAREVARALLRGAWKSVAALAIAPLQDLLNLGNEARMNVPGRGEGNWRWRCTEDMLSTSALERRRAVTTNASRSQRSAGEVCALNRHGADSHPTVRNGE